MRTLGSQTITREDGSTYTDIDGTVVDGYESLRQRIVARLVLFRGAWLPDPTAGIFDLATLPGTDSEGRAMIAQQIRASLLDDPEIRSVDRLEVNVPSPRHISIEVTVRTIYADMSLSVNVA